MLNILFCLIAVNLVISAISIFWNRKSTIIDHGISDKTRIDALVQGSIVELRDVAKKSSGGRIHIHDVEVVLNSHYKRLGK
jgi:hypothetical protein